ncbi:MAG TPA: hypothetical protein VFY29_07605, partial [Terriglobia bacterium]|nr:hypothetical protein [Terriglobia bacterium]
VDMLDVRAAKVGDTVWFKAADDLRVSGRTALSRGSLIHSEITQIQPGAGPNGTPAFQFALDQALPSNAPAVKLPPSFVTLIDTTGSASVGSLVGGVSQLAGAVNGARTSGWKGAANASSVLTQGTRPAAAPGPNLPRGALFEARF